MKRSLLLTLLTIGLAVMTLSLRAQQRALEPDQNPRARESAGKYSRMIDSLTSNQGATVQNTYKAYDWYKAREARRDERRRYSNAYFNSGYYSNYGFGSSLFYPAYGRGYYNSFGGAYLAPTFRFGGRGNRYHH